MWGGSSETSSGTLPNYGKVKGHALNEAGGFQGDARVSLSNYLASQLLNLDHIETPHIMNWITL